MPCLCFTQAQCRHTVQLPVVNNSEEAGSPAVIPSQPSLQYKTSSSINREVCNLIMNGCELEIEFTHANSCQCMRVQNYALGMWNSSKSKCYVLA